MIRFSKNIVESAPYPFKKVNDLKAEYMKKGIKVIDLGVGDTSLSAPAEAVDALKKAADNPENHHYNYYNGYPFFREAASIWMKKKHFVDIDPESEVSAVIGTKEGLFRITSAFIDAGDIALIPTPAYPAIQSGVETSGGKAFFIPLRVENRFLPDFSEVPEKIRNKAKFIYINYPNNPTSATMDTEFAKELLKQAEKYNWAIISDMAYSEVYENKKNISLLEIEGAKERVIEFHSLSKSFSMTGFRIGFAAGNREIISSLVKIKAIRGSSPFQPVQAAGASAMLNCDEYLVNMRYFYKNNRVLLKSIFLKNNIEYFDSQSTFYVWAKVPQGYDSMEFATMMIEKYGTVITPGAILGKHGEGWFRACFACKTEDLIEFGNRLEGVK